MEEENIFYNNHETYVRWMQSIFILNLEKMISKTVFISRINTTEIEISIQNPFIITITSIFKNHSLFLFKQLTELAVIDYPTRSNRFKINYVLSSITFNTKLILSVHVKELQPILSLVELYESAEWLEREAWDLFGIHFQGNKNLRRIVTDYGFKGHPLRKDFPLTGFVEVYYNDEEKKIVYELVELAQEYRVFSLQNQWNNQNLTEITEN